MAHKTKSVLLSYGPDQIKVVTEVYKELNRKTPKKFLKYQNELQSSYSSENMTFRISPISGVNSGANSGSTSPNNSPRSSLRSSPPEKSISISNLNGSLPTRTSPDQTYVMDIFDSIKNPDTLGWGQITKSNQFQNIKIFIPFMTNAYQLNTVCMQEMTKAMRKKIVILPIIMEKSFRPRNSLQWMYNPNLSIIHFYKFEDDVEEFCSVLKNHVRQVLKGLGVMRGARMPYTNVRRQGDTLLSRLKSSKELQRVKIKQMKKSSVF